jgi:hypothetical protein
MGFVIVTGNWFYRCSSASDWREIHNYRGGADSARLDDANYRSNLFSCRN